MLALAAALVLSAQPSNTWLEEARALISALKFGEAFERLEVARQVPGLDATTKQSILESEGFAGGREFLATIRL